MFVLVMLIFYRTLIDQTSSSDVWPILFGLAILQQAPVACIEMNFSETGADQT